MVEEFVILVLEKIFQKNLELSSGGSESVRLPHPISAVIKEKPGWPGQEPGSGAEWARRPRPRGPRACRFVPTPRGPLTVKAACRLRFDKSSRNDSNRMLFCYSQAPRYSSKQDCRYCTGPTVETALSVTDTPATWLGF